MPTPPDHGHAPIMPAEVGELLNPQPGQIVLDATLGRGGHAALLIPQLAGEAPGAPSGGTSGETSGGGAYIGLDLDPANSEYARDRLGPIAEAHGVRLHVVHASFTQAPAVLRELGFAGGVDMLLADLGFASNQVDQPERGLSFNSEGPLDMRLNPGGDLTAADLIAQLPERELGDVIYRYGEERLSRRIARKIVDARQHEPIQTTSQLAELVRRAYGPKARGSRIHPATRTFQALRIAVNGEIEALERLLADLPVLLKPGVEPGHEQQAPGQAGEASGGRAAVLSFHSLEDRPVKQRFLQLAQDHDWQRLTRKPRTAGPEEQAANPRSRSAKLRAIRRGRD